MVKTDAIIRGEHNKEYLVSPKEILTWYPGDFVRQCYQCPKDSYYHTCRATEIQWRYVLDIAQSDDRYYQIYKSIKRLGFVTPLRAKITTNSNIMLVDGHNRVGIAIDLNIDMVPVYVADKASDPFDLVLPDSNAWQKNNKPWLPTEWKDIAGYEGVYSISKTGHVWSYSSKRILSTSLSKGYPKVELYRYGKARTTKIHKLVSETFIGPCPMGLEVCHNDGDKQNNNLNNLRYGTKEANARDKILHGTNLAGSDHPNTKLTDKVVFDIWKALNAGMQPKDISKQFNISDRIVKDISSGATWLHLRHLDNRFWTPEFQTKSSYLKALEATNLVNSGLSIDSSCRKAGLNSTRFEQARSMINIVQARLRS